MAGAMVQGTASFHVLDALGSGAKSRASDRHGAASGRRRARAHHARTSRVVEGLDERKRRGRMTTVEFSVEVEAPPEMAWQIASDPRNLPQWDKHIVRVDLPDGGMERGARYEVVMGMMGVQTTVHATVLEWEPPWRSSVQLDRTARGHGDDLGGVAAVRPQSMLRHEVSFRFRGPFGRFGAAGLNAMGGAQYALRRGVLAQKREIEERARA